MLIRILPGVKKISRDILKILSMNVILNDISRVLEIKSKRQHRYRNFPGSSLNLSISPLHSCFLEAYLYLRLSLPPSLSPTHQLFLFFCLLPTKTNVEGDGATPRHPSPQDSLNRARETPNLGKSLLEKPPPPPRRQHHFLCNKMNSETARAVLQQPLDHSR